MSLNKNELIVDSFAGGGGASLGIAWATGRSPDIAINHDAGALKMHAANHPDTLHVAEDVWKARMSGLIADRPIGLLWASPDCRDFSRAKGDKPIKKAIRSLAWVVVRWAVQFQPRVIFLENVREFEEWGPLVPQFACQSCEWKGPEGQATLCRTRRRCPRCNSVRLKQTDRHIRCPKRKGITFRRFVGRLRNLGYVVQWRCLNAADFGAPTHRRRLFLVARRDGLPIVWPEPTHAAPEKCQPGLFGTLKPYRTAAECIDWSTPCPSIFDRKEPLAPATMARIANGIRRYILDAPKPFLVPLTHSGNRRCPTLDEPLPTITTANRGELALVAPVISRQFGNSIGCRADGPLPTVTAGGSGKSALVAAFLAKHFGGVVGVPINEPFPTITSIGTQNQLVAANLVHMNHGAKQWSCVEEPMRTITSNNHAYLVYSFLIRYFGTAIGQHVTEPLFTITGKDRFGLVVVQIEGEFWAITDIGMRMLTARELARCQGFPDTYILTGTKTDQVKRIGNSVSPYPAAALIRANSLELAGV